MLYNFFHEKADLKPLTLLSVLQMYDYETGNITNIRNLPSAYHDRIFDFNYPLTTNLNKNDFEVRFLKHFLTRRIGFETVTLFKIYLEDKLNLIMPRYNLMIDNLYFNANLLSKTDTDVEIFDGDSSSSSSNSGETAESASTSTSSNSTTTNDNRSSDTPQNSIDDIKSGEYVSDYSYDTNIVNASDSTSSSGNSSSSSSNSTTSTNDSTRTTTRTSNINGLELIEINERLASIYEMLFKDLDVLFYQLF